MAKFAHQDVLDGGLNVIQTAATTQLLISSYTAGESYAVVTAKILASVAMISTDYTKSSSGSDRLLTTASGKSAVASASATGTPDLHLAFTDGTSRVLWVTDETSNQAVTSGNTVSFPQVTYRSNQPA